MIPGTCIPLPVRLPTPGSLMSLAAGQLGFAMVVGIAAIGGSYLAVWSGALAWLGRVSLGTPLVAVVVVPLVVSLMCAAAATVAIDSDDVMDESLNWASRSSSAVGLLCDELPPHLRRIRAWNPAWCRWLALPLGWLVVLALTLPRLVPLVRDVWARYPAQRRQSLRRAAEYLDAYASAVDAVTLRSPTGTYFGCLVHPVPHAVRTRHIKDRFLAALPWAGLPGCIWCGVVLAYLPFGWTWGGLLVAHLLSIAALWGVGVARIHLLVAQAWRVQQTSMRLTVRDATSERDVVMRLVEESTWEAP